MARTRYVDWPAQPACVCLPAASWRTPTNAWELSIPCVPCALAVGEPRKGCHAVRSHPIAIPAGHRAHTLKSSQTLLSRITHAATSAPACPSSPHTPQVIKLISQVIADFANGEISQAASLFDTETTLESYLDKSFYKTASLIAASCRSASVFRCAGCRGPSLTLYFPTGMGCGMHHQTPPQPAAGPHSSMCPGEGSGQWFASPPHQRAHASLLGRALHASVSHLPLPAPHHSTPAQ